MKSWRRTHFVLKPIMKTKLILCSLVATAAACTAGAAGFQASLTPDIALQSKTTEISGLSLSIWGENPQHGVALGFINGSTGDSSGFSWAFLANYDDSYTGVQWGFVNLSKKSFVGWQSGFINIAQGDFQGLQWGLVNYSENLNGVQIGLANIAENNDWFTSFPDQLAKGFPFVNWSF